MLMSRLKSSRRDFLRDASSLIVPSMLLAGSTRALAKAPRPSAGAVYALTNSASGNAVVVFLRAANGALTQAKMVSTGGLGLGDGPDSEGLQSQGALVLGPGRNHLYAVNGGSDTISVFVVKPRGLSLVQKIASGGHTPISLTVHGNILYALNYDRQAMPARGGNITGFLVHDDGRLAPLANSSRPLSGVGTNPGQVAFSLDGKLLAVTEKATNQILTYTVDHHGKATGPQAFPSNSEFPFSLAFGPNDLLVVADDFDDVPTKGAASSFQGEFDGSLTHVSGPVPNHQDGSCWVVVSSQLRIAYVVNTNNSVISAYIIDANGGLSLLDGDGVTAHSGGIKPRDLAFSRNGRFLYVLNSGSGTVGGFAVMNDGHLQPLGVIGDFPAPGSNGLAAF